MIDTDLAETEARLAPRVRTMQIIAGFMLAGVLTIGGVFALVNAGAAGDGIELEGGVELEQAEADVRGGELDADLDPGDPVLSYVGLAIGALALVSHLPLGSLAGRFAASGGAVGAFQTRLLVRLAILEGATVINLVFLLAEDWWPSWLMVGALIVAMLAQFPTPGAVRRYVESRRQLAELEPQD